MDNLLLDNPFFKSPVLYFDQTGSTMDTAAEYIEKGYPSGTVIMAAYQTQGRGRGRVRRWEADPGSSLLCTLILKAGDCPVPVHHIPVCTGLGVCSWLSSGWDLPAMLKWPNDVLVSGRKICGVLCETSRSWIRIGFGINLNQKTLPVFRDDGIVPTSLRMETGSEVHFEPEAVIQEVLRALHREFFPDQGKAGGWIERANALLYRRNQRVRIRKGPADNPETEDVTIVGINEDGALSVRTARGETADVYSAEILYGIPADDR
ncbi:MAG: biotin--[acetyl-CoA-carboxylase] ligase [Spirochaetales bacterium]|nr:biotin--[acetyl-CoA-carboxylase] ligase [Spirochaetales bacterium]